MIFVATTFLFTPFAFLFSLFSANNEYVLGFNLTNSLIATPPVLSFNFPMTDLFASS